MRILLLGPVELRRPDGTLVHIGGTKRRAILAALALEANRVVPAQRLVQMLWDADPPSSARTVVQGHIAALRGLLDDSVRLVTRAPGYVLEAESDLVDVYRERALVDQASTASDHEATALLRQAMALWRGAALTGCGSTPLCQALAQRLDDSRATVLEQWAELSLRLGRGEQTLSDLREALIAWPLREPLVRLLMLSLCQAGRPAEAVELFHTTKARLADELGLDPGPEIRDALLHAINRAAGNGTAAVAATAPQPVRGTTLPRAAHGFFGRSAELAWLEQVSDSAREDVQVIALTGPAGVGKTALVLHWAARAQDRFPGGLHYVDLRGFDVAEPVPTGEALAVLLRSLGVPDSAIPDTPAVRAELYQQTLSRLRAAVVLESARDLAQVAPLLPARQSCLAIVTSRRRLTDLVAGQGAAVLTLEPLPHDNGFDVLAAITGADRLTAEPEAATRVVELCEGLPLALRIAAARLATRPRWPVSALADELADERFRLSALSTDGSLSVQAALDSSCAALPDSAAQLHRLLGVLPGRGIDVFATSALAGVTLSAGREHLATLAAAHLADQDADTGRYSRHDLIRLHAKHAAEQLVPAERDAALSRLLDYYLAATASAFQSLSSSTLRPAHTPTNPPAGGLPELGSAPATLQWFRTEESDIRELTLSALDGPLLEQACAVTENLGRLYIKAGFGTAEMEKLLAAALKSAEAAGIARRWPKLYEGHCITLAILGRHAEAVAQGKRALAALDGDDDPRLRLTVCSNLAWALVEDGDPHEGIRYLQEALDVARQLGDVPNIAGSLTNLAYTQLQIGDADNALKSAREAQQVLQAWLTVVAAGGEATRGDSIGLLDAKLVYAYALRALGRDDDAMDVARETAEEGSREQYPPVARDSRLLIGDLLAERGERSAACVQWRIAATYSAQEGVPADDIATRIAVGCGRPSDQPCQECAQTLADTSPPIR
ncbi:AfsR/SARP family transcriptional regulator [Catenulispora rubra]|uniref:AfsR/SARP family transcriptional regulator n=1 Tax=Catenulispora rubra TaxID=280293 RepID=UPI001892648A|nr:BTAD domain-containing putative transcriptional regulator [Catenulispora rubra]